MFNVGALTMVGFYYVKNCNTGKDCYICESETINTNSIL